MFSLSVIPEHPCHSLFAFWRRRPRFLLILLLTLLLCITGTVGTDAAEQTSSFDCAPSRKDSRSRNRNLPENGRRIQIQQYLNTKRRKNTKKE